MGLSATPKLGWFTWPWNLPRMEASILKLKLRWEGDRGNQTALRFLRLKKQIAKARYSNYSHLIDCLSLEVKAYKWLQKRNMLQIVHIIYLIFWREFYFPTVQVRKQRLLGVILWEIKYTSKMTSLEMTTELWDTTSATTRPGRETLTSAATISPEHLELGPWLPASIFLPLLLSQNQTKKIKYAP